MNRFAIVTLEPAESILNEELELEIRRRLQSSLFSIKRISVVDEDSIVKLDTHHPKPIIQTPSRTRKQLA